MYQILSKENDKTTVVYESPNALVVDTVFDTLIQYARSEGWKITTLMNGRKQCKRDKQVIQYWKHTKDEGMVLS